MTCLEQHRQHLAPQVSGFNTLEQLHLAGAGLLFVGLIALLKGPAV